MSVRCSPCGGPNGTAAGLLSPLPPLPPRRGCVCTEKEVRFTFTYMLALLAIVVGTVVLFVSTVRGVRRWAREKRALKDQVKQLARATASMLEQRARSADGAPPHQDPVVLRWLDDIEGAHPGEGAHEGGAARGRRCRKGAGFFFVIDTDGRVWAHGKAPHLARGPLGRTPGLHDLRDLDVPQAHTTPVADIVRAAKRGGGYVRFRWKRDQPLLAYVAPVAGTRLILGGAVPPPCSSHHPWEEPLKYMRLPAPSADSSLSTLRRPSSAE